MFDALFAHHLPTLHGFVTDWVTLHGLVVMLGLAIYAIGSHTLRQRRHPSAGIAWIVSLVLLPYVALPLYLMFGSRKRVAYRRAGADLPSGVSGVTAGLGTAGRLEAAMGLPQAAGFEQLAVHEDGREAWHALREMLETAQHSIDVCSFLLGNDALGDAVIALLQRRARDGVRIRFLIDGIGIYLGGRTDLRQLAQAGIEVALFVSPLRSALRGKTNLRNHRKMVLADGRWLWCGGRNLAAEYFEGDTSSVIHKPVWIDLSFDLRGPVVMQAVQRFDADWAFARRGRPTRVSEAAVDASDIATGNDLVGAAPPPRSARLVASGPDQAEDTIHTLLVAGCFQASRRILAATPYFVPDPTLLMALTLAARRGVQVDMVLPRRSNHVLADMARHAALRELAAAGGRVWLAPGMVHAKAILIDEELALVGSANLDGRSLFLNYELMVAFYDAPVVAQFALWVDGVRDSAERYEARAPGALRELGEGMVRWVAFQL